MTNHEVFEFLNENEKDAYDFVVQELKVIFRQSANQTMLRKFSDSFKKADDGNRRNWREIPEEQIKELFETCKAKHMPLLDEFKQIVFP